MRRIVAAAVVFCLPLGMLLALAGPASADTAGRPDDGTPDEIYYDVFGPDYPEDKSGGNSPSGGSKTVNVQGQSGTSALMGAAATATTVTFPYSNYNWTINSWTSTNDGLRIYGAYYKSKQVFYDYRVPWIKVALTRYALTTNQLVSGPDLQVYYNPGMFLVKAKYNLGNPNVDVTVITRFYGNGAVEPWVLVDTHGVPSILMVPERFDFDLAGSGDDSQQYYDGTAWKYSATEHDTSDNSYSENASGYQWRTFDTDQQGNGYIYNVEVDVTPYHSDLAVWFHLAYCAFELSSDPGGYESNQVINTYSATAPDPWLGADAVNWYVASYAGVTVAYPGPWLKVKV